MKVRPINAYVLVKPFEVEETTGGGIVLPDTAKGRRNTGEVVAMAEDAIDEVALGDRVIYKELTGTEVDIDGEKHILLSSEDLLCKYAALDAIPE